MNMDGHHLILGQLADFLTGEILEDTHDERYRQKLARFLATQKGYAKSEILPRHELRVKAGENCALIRIDLAIKLGDKIGMLVKYGPGSITTRHRPVLAASRLLAPYQIPVAIVTNGEDCDVLDGATGTVLASGLDQIPDRMSLTASMQKASFQLITPHRTEMESRILFAYEIDGACPCDDTVCRL
jgi:Type I restriction enzyme R protein N terminus (HSDR_N)